MSDYLLVITTIDDPEAARRLAKSLVEGRAAACVNIVPSVLSVYRWKGEVEEGNEYLLLMKTTEDAFEALSKAVSELHPYDLPELIALPVESGSRGYLEWIRGSVSGAAAPSQD